MPVDITTDFNVPVYIDGTNVSAGYEFPWYQGTSSTANGYLQNSTSSFNPAQASVLSIANGTDNWWIYMFVQPTGGFQNGWTVSIPIESTLVADSNTKIQLVPFYVLSSAPSTLIAYTYLMDTFNMEADLPIKVVKQTTYPATSGMLGMGYIIRNMVSGTRVTGIAGALNLLRNS
jgi:hypothetical protein